MRFFFILAIGCIFLVSCGYDSEKHLAQSLLAYNEHKYDDLPATGILVQGVREIHVDAYAFHFEPEIIIVEQGEKVRLIVDAKDVPHGFEIEGFIIPEYDINTKIRKDIPLTIEFVADEKGVWPFICTLYCGYGHSKMKGVFVIR